MEYISGAAIKYRDDKNSYLYDIISGNSHGDIIKEFAKMNLRAKDRYDEELGFITNQNRFVDRYEALKIAEASGQIVQKTPGNGLFSEDLLNRETGEYTYVQ